MLLHVWPCKELMYTSVNDRKPRVTTDFTRMKSPKEFELQRGIGAQPDAPFVSDDPIVQLIRVSGRLMQCQFRQQTFGLGILLIPFDHLC
jgi:hypothetical protein